MFSALSAVFVYFKDILILDRVVSTSQFEMYDPEKAVQEKMVIDSQAFQHLELLEVH